MHYPKNREAVNIWEEMSSLYAKLAAAYSIIAQYEEDERRREDERMREFLVDRQRPKARTEAAHREDEAQ
jgi:hypothetical protein